MLLIIIWYFFHNYFWPQPPEIGLGLVALASASRFWPRLTSLLITPRLRDIYRSVTNNVMYAILGIFLLFTHTVI